MTRSSLADDGGYHALRQRSFDQICELSAHIIAGNEWLAERAGQHHKTTVIPTVIDTDQYLPPDRDRRSRRSRGRGLDGHRLLV